MNDFLNNNIADLAGEIAGNFVYSHTCNGEKFHMAHLKTKRRSGVDDTIPIMVSDRLLNFDRGKDYNGIRVALKGQFRSYSKRNGSRSKLELFAFATEFLPESKDEYINFVSLNGVICKEPTYRTTPSGREITDVFIAVHRPYGTVDYIPCIAWGRNARYARNFEVGNDIHIAGRMQSREYIKKHADGTRETRIAYEVSASEVYVIEKESEE